MYSRSLDPRRVPQTLPNHYGGSAFRSDGTPTPIPVKREYSLQSDPPRKNDAPSTEAVKALPREETEDTDVLLSDPEEEPTEADSVLHAEDALPVSALKEDSDGSFLSRTLGALFPELRTDDLILLLLMLLLSREKGNEDVLLILAVLLFGK